MLQRNQNSVAQQPDQNSVAKQLNPNTDLKLSSTIHQQTNLPFQIIGKPHQPYPLSTQKSPSAFTSILPPSLSQINSRLEFQIQQNQHLSSFELCNSINPLTIQHLYQTLHTKPSTQNPPQKPPLKSPPPSPPLPPPPHLSSHNHHPQQKTKNKKPKKTNIDKSILNHQFESEHAPKNFIRGSVHFLFFPPSLL